MTPNNKILDLINSFSNELLKFVNIQEKQLSELDLDEQTRRKTSKMIADLKAGKADMKDALRFVNEIKNDAANNKS